MKITSTDMEEMTYIAQYGDNELQHRLYIRRVSPRISEPSDIILHLSKIVTPVLHGKLNIALEFREYPGLCIILMKVLKK